MQSPFDRRGVSAGLLAALGAAAAAALGGCASGASQGPLATSALGSAKPEATPAKSLDRNAVKVALLLPLSGSPQTAAVAKAMREAAELALFELRDSEVQLIVKDDLGTEEGATRAAHEAIAAGAEVILGPLFARSVKAASAVARKANVPVIAFSNDPSVAGQGTYLLSFSPAGEASRIAEHTVRSGRRRVAALIPADAEGRVIEPAFRSAVERAGGTVSFVEKFTVETSGLVSVGAELRDLIRDTMSSESPLEAILVPGSQETLPQTVSLLTQAGLDPARVKLIGTSGWNFPNAGLNHRLVGGWFAAPEPKGWSEFAERYGRAYRSMPPRIASLAHDAVLVAGALAAGRKGERYSAAAITRSSGFTGADGAFRFAGNGGIERALAVLEVQKTGALIVDLPASLAAPAQTAMSLGQPRGTDRLP